MKVWFKGVGHVVRESKAYNKHRKTNDVMERMKKKSSLVGTIQAFALWFVGLS
jgi:hypothetical protein